MRDHSPKEYITLKEASKISGYSADYIGQLIRKGKIPGRQIYTNIAWVTTEESIRDYLEKEGRGGKGNVSQEDEQDPFTQDEELDLESHEEAHALVTGRMISWLLYLSLVVVVICALALFFVFAISIDRHVSEEHYRANIEGTNKSLSVESDRSYYAKR